MINKSFYSLASKSWIVNSFGEDGGTLITPAQLQNKPIPHMAFFVGTRDSIRMSPSQNFFVRATRESAFANICI